MKKLIFATYIGMSRFPQPYSVVTRTTGMKFHRNRTETEIWIFYRTETEPEPKFNTEIIKRIFQYFQSNF